MIMDKFVKRSNPSEYIISLSNIIDREFRKDIYDVLSLFENLGEEGLVKIFDSYKYTDFEKVDLETCDNSIIRILVVGYLYAYNTYPNGDYDRIRRSMCLDNIITLLMNIYRMNYPGYTEDEYYSKVITYRDMIEHEITSYLEYSAYEVFLDYLYGKDFIKSDYDQAMEYICKSHASMIKELLPYFFGSLFSTKDCIIMIATSIKNSLYQFIHMYSDISILDFLQDTLDEDIYGHIRSIFEVGYYE